MFGWGVFLIIVGLCSITEGGIIFVIPGAILILIAMVKYDEESTITNNMHNKLTYIIDFLEYICEDCSPEDEKNIKIQIHYYETLRSICNRLNSNGIEQINKMYYLIQTDVEEKRKETLNIYYEYYDYNAFCPIAVAGNNYEMLEHEIEQTSDYKKLNIIYNVIKYLMLINENLEISKKGYKCYNITTIGLPQNPNKIHVDAMKLLVTKMYLDGRNHEVLNFLYNELFSKSLYSKGVETAFEEIKYFYDKNLKKLTSAFEKNEIEEIIPIMIILNPNYMKNYNPNKKSYEILGISSNATEEEIEKAYKKMLINNHPDRGGDEKKWAEINEAYARVKSDSYKSNKENSSSMFEYDTETNTYTCDNCGAYVEDEDTECPKCGLKFKEEEQDDELEEQYTCDNCGAYVEDEDAECPKCGLKFKEEEQDDELEEQYTCDNCGAYVEDEDTKCPKCGLTFK